MNERIQELHEQAMKSCDEHRSDILNYHRIYREKFAELIIRECIDVLNPDNDLTSMREEYGRKMSMQLIKEYFGVEE